MKELWIGVKKCRTTQMLHKEERGDKWAKCQAGTSFPVHIAPEPWLPQFHLPRRCTLPSCLQWLFFLPKALYPLPHPLPPFHQICAQMLISLSSSSYLHILKYKTCLPTPILHPIPNFILIKWKSIYSFINFIMSLYAHTPTHWIELILIAFDLISIRMQDHFLFCLFWSSVTLC